MFVRRSRQRNKNGQVRNYIQIVEAYRTEEGKPTNRVVGHLGVGSDLLYENLKTAFAAARQGQPVTARMESSDAGAVEVSVVKSLLYLPVAMVNHFFQGFGLDHFVEQLCPVGQQEVSTATVLAALVANRCIEPGSKLAFQKWIKQVAAEAVFGCPAERLNNTRVHRCLHELAQVDEALQEKIAERITERQGRPRVLYLDLTDTWFEAGGGSLARKGETKQGHRCKRKITIALMVNEDGLPMRWQLLPGTLSETTVLPDWLPKVKGQQRYSEAVLVFDRGLPTIENFFRLIDGKTGHCFLTSIKSDAIPTYLKLDIEALDALQAFETDAPRAKIAVACNRLGLHATASRPDTFRQDLGVVIPPKPNSSTKKQPPKMRMYLYFNPAIWRTKRKGREERLQAAADFVAELNEQLAKAKKSRTPNPIQAKVTERLRKLKLLEAHEIELEPIEIEIPTKPIRSYRVHLRCKDAAQGDMCHRDDFNAAADFVTKLNQRLARSKKSKEPESIRAKVEKRLLKLKLLEAHEIDLEPIEIKGKPRLIRSYRVRLLLNDAIMRNMCRYDGFNLLAGHPDVELSCDEAIDIYRQKNTVEADFRTIKSVLNLRPTFHWTDDKILSHVTLCVVALLVERLMERECLSSDAPRTASSILAELTEARLHRIRIDTTNYWCLTNCRPEVRQLASNLGGVPLLNRFQTTVSHRADACSN
jgi:hypothetical protein